MPRSIISPSWRTRIWSAWMIVDKRWAMMIVVRFWHMRVSDAWMFRSVVVSSADVACKIHKDIVQYMYNKIVIVYCSFIFKSAANWISIVWWICLSLVNNRWFCTIKHPSLYEGLHVYAQIKSCYICISVSKVPWSTL